MKKLMIGCVIFLFMVLALGYFIPTSVLADESKTGAAEKIETTTKITKDGYTKEVVVVTCEGKGNVICVATATTTTTTTTTLEP